MNAEPSGSHQLVAKLVALWEVEDIISQALQATAERTQDDRLTAILKHEWEMCIVRRSRITKIAVVGARPAGPLLLPVVPDNTHVPRNLQDAIPWILSYYRAAAERYAQAARCSRVVHNPTAAWICELGRAGMLDAITAITHATSQEAA
jgi:hypothetical protein